MRWKGKLKALYLIHEEIVKEMKKRGFNHKSHFEIKNANGYNVQKDFVDSIEKQINILKNKKCRCKF